MSVWHTIEYLLWGEDHARREDRKERKDHFDDKLDELKFTQKKLDEKLDKVEEFLQKMRR